MIGKKILSVLVISPDPNVQGGVSALWVSTGHGHLGWTMAVGSAQLLTDLINGTSPSVDPTPYSLKRFS